MELTKLAIKAFYYSIPYAKNCFQNSGDRTFIFNKIVEAFVINDDEVQERCLQCLSEFVVHGYDFLSDHFMQMAQASEACTKSENARVGA